MDRLVLDFLRYKYPEHDVALYEKLRSEGIYIPSNISPDMVAVAAGYPSYNALIDAGYTSTKITDQLVELNEAAPVIERYLRTRGTDINNIFRAFEKLQPNFTGNGYLHTLVDFIRWEASAYITSRKLPAHVTSFGTGGDAQPTLNISTIASIVAAHYLKENPVFRDYVESVTKIGTRAITADVGSSDIAERLGKFYPEKSGYISLTQMGFTKGYTAQVIESRRRLPEYGHMDICKIIFPPANLSNAKAAITGCSDERYMPFIRSIAGYVGHISVIASSASGHDEIMPGKNTIMLKKPGQGWVVETVQMPTGDETRRFLKARPDIDRQEKASVNILKGNAPDNALRVIAANAALFFLPAFENGNIAKDLEPTTNNITDFLISQRSRQTIVHNNCRI